MKIAPRSIDSFVAAPPATLRAVLVYGPDSGLVRERGKMLMRAIVDDPDDPFRIATLEAAQDLRGLEGIGRRHSLLCRRGQNA